MTMTDRLQELRRIAEAATPGPWEVVGLVGYGGPYALRMPHRSGRTWYGVEGIKRREDAEYIATFDPPTVLALLNEIERLRRERDAALDACEKARNVLALIETFDELIRTPRRRFEEAIDAIDLALLTARGEEVLATLRGEA